MEEYVLLRFTQFIESDEFKIIAKWQDKAGGKARQYKRRFKKGTLTNAAMLAFLLESGLIEDIKIKELK